MWCVGRAELGWMWRLGTLVAKTRFGRRNDPAHGVRGSRPRRRCAAPQARARSACGEPNRPWAKSRIAPITTQLSATLKTGKLKLPAWK